MNKRTVFQIWVETLDLKFPFATFNTFDDLQLYIDKHLTYLDYFDSWEVVKFLEVWKA